MSSSHTKQKDWYSRKEALTHIFKVVKKVFIGDHALYAMVFDTVPVTYEKFKLLKTTIEELSVYFYQSGIITPKYNSKFYKQRYSSITLNVIPQVPIILYVWSNINLILEDCLYYYHMYNDNDVILVENFNKHKFYISSFITLWINLAHESNDAVGYTKFGSDQIKLTVEDVECQVPTQITDEITGETKTVYETGHQWHLVQTKIN